MKCPTKGKENLKRSYPKVKQGPPGWGMGPPTCLQILNPEGLLSKRNMEAECGAVTEGKAIQRLPHIGIHPID
jgi:hypothetical protein